MTITYYRQRIKNRFFYLGQTVRGDIFGQSKNLTDGFKKDHIPSSFKAKGCQNGPYGSYHTATISIDQHTDPNPNRPDPKYVLCRKIPVHTPIEKYSRTKLFAAALMARPKAAKTAPTAVTTRQPYLLTNILAMGPEPNVTPT